MTETVMLRLKRSAAAMFVLFFLSAVVYVSMTSTLFQIERVAVSGEISDAQQIAIYEILQDPKLTNLPMKKIQLRLEAIDWVRESTLSRGYPDLLAVVVVPQKPIALWNDDAYLNEEGRVFRSPFVNQKRLPQLYGPVGEQEAVMSQYLQLNSVLFEVGQKISQLTLGDRGNWVLENNLGIEVLLGKTALMDRVKRLIKVTDFIADKQDLTRIKQIDSRYVNGVAIAWKSDVDVESLANKGAQMKLVTNYNSQRESTL